MKIKTSFAALLLLILSCSIITLCGCGSNSSSGGGSSSIGTPYIYVSCYSDKVINVINGSTNTLVGTIDAQGYSPEYMAGTYNGRYIYCQTSSNDVLVINTATNTVESKIWVPGYVFNGDKAVITNNGKLLFVIRWGSPMYKVFTASGTNESIPLSDNGQCGVFNSDCSKLYVPTAGNTVDIIDVATGAPHSINVQTSPDPDEISAAINNSKLYMTLKTSRECIVIDTSSENIVNVITTEASSQRCIIAAPGKNELFVSQDDVAGKVYIIDPSVPTYESTYIQGPGGSGFTQPTYMAASIDGRRIYAYDSVKTYQLAVINTSAKTIEAYVPYANGDRNYNNVVVVYK
jgi:YVTN family beta-propeller protein